MTHTEVEQCVLDIKTWFERKGNADFSPASASDFQRLEKSCDDAVIPDGLEVLLSHMNGGLWFMEKEAMSTSRIAKVIAQNVASKHWDPLFIPFCGDADDMLIIDTDSKKIFEWDSQDGLGDAVAPSFSRYLEEYRNSLLGGQLEYVDGCGVIENMNKGKSAK